VKSPTTVAELNAPIRDYARAAAPEPEILRIVGEEAKRNGTDKLTTQKINRIIKATRRSQSRR